MAKELGPGHTIVTVLCDYGTRYQTKLFNPEFLRKKQLPVPEFLERKREIPGDLYV
jgi:cysteine synthase A